MSSLSLSTDGGQSCAPLFMCLESSVPSLHLCNTEGRAGERASRRERTRERAAQSVSC